MILNIVIEVSDKSFEIINGRPRIHRLVDNIVENIKYGPLNTVYNPIIYLLCNSSTDIFRQNEVYLNNLKNKTVIIMKSDDNTLARKADYELYLRSGDIYLDNNWLYNLLTFANKYGLNQTKILANDFKGHLIFREDVLTVFSKEHDNNSYYIINDILKQ